MDNTTTDRLVELMTARWCSHGNEPSAALQTSWRQAFNVFDQKIEEHGTKDASRWHVLSPKTGTGKSEGLKVYAAAKAADTMDAPGILIVVRMTAQADEFVADIREMAGDKYAAVAAHSAQDTAQKVSADELRDYSTLVITHAAFSGSPRRNAELWDQYMSYGSGRRKLVVIDEAIQVLDISRVHSTALAKLEGNVPPYARERWPEGWKAIQKMAELTRTIEALPAHQTRDSRLVIDSARRREMQEYEADWGGIEQLDEIRRYMKSGEHRYMLGKKDVDKDAERRQKARYDELFRDLIAVYSNFTLHSKSGRRCNLTTARKLLPDDGQGCVVMDATADTNPLYECMERDTLSVLKHPAISSRTYENTTLKTSVGHAVGRSSLVKRRTVKRSGKVEHQPPKLLSVAPKLFDALTAEHKRRAKTSCPMARVLVVSFKGAVEHLHGFDTPFEYAVAHYGALDGLNEWRDFDTVVIVGLDYRHPADAPASVMALQEELQTNAFFEDTAGARSFRGHADIRKAIDLGVISSSLIQAVNRIRTRRVIDTAGNCPESYVYLLLPDNQLGAAVHRTLLDQMPGMRTENWKLDAAKQAKRSKHEQAVIGLAKSMEPGESYSAAEVQERLGIPRTTWGRIVSKLKSDTATLGQALAELQVIYEVTGSGRTHRAFLRRL
ncbi:MAG: hypothetical protein AAFQ62_05390 [Pseudomonadota bacterium]